MQGANSNQEECLRLAERVTEIICAIIDQNTEWKDSINMELNQDLNGLAE
jgi:hypothetical protein